MLRKSLARIAEIDYSQLERIIAGLADIARFRPVYRGVRLGDVYALSGLKSRQIATSRR
jgi:hypothetical protein